MLLSLRYVLCMCLVIARRLAEVWSSLQGVYMDGRLIRKRQWARESTITSSAHDYSQWYIVLQHNIILFVVAQQLIHSYQYHTCNDSFWPWCLANQSLRLVAEASRLAPFTPYLYQPSSTQQLGAVLRVCLCGFGSLRMLSSCSIPSAPLHVNL